MCKPCTKTIQTECAWKTSNDDETMPAICSHNFKVPLFRPGDAAGVQWLFTITAQLIRAWDASHKSGQADSFTFRVVFVSICSCFNKKILQNLQWFVVFTTKSLGDSKSIWYLYYEFISLTPMRSFQSLSRKEGEIYDISQQRERKILERKILERKNF